MTTVAEWSAMIGDKVTLALPHRWAGDRVTADALGDGDMTVAVYGIVCRYS